MNFSFKFPKYIWNYISKVIDAQKIFILPKLSS